jgi:hypothetical protein
MIYIFRAGIAIAEAEQKILTADEEGYMYGVKFEKFSKGRHWEVSIGNCFVLSPFTMCYFSKGIQTINSTGKFIGII